MRGVDRFIRKYGEAEGRALYRRLQQLAAQGCAVPRQKRVRPTFVFSGVLLALTRDR